MKFGQKKLFVKLIYLISRVFWPGLFLNFLAYCVFWGEKSFDEFFFYFLGTLEGIKKFVETDGEYGKAAPDHDEL